MTRTSLSSSLRTNSLCASKNPCCPLLWSYISQSSSPLCLDWQQGCSQPCWNTSDACYFQPGHRGLPHRLVTLVTFLADWDGNIDTALRSYVWNTAALGHLRSRCTSREEPASLTSSTCSRSHVATSRLIRIEHYARWKPCVRAGDNTPAKQQLLSWSRAPQQCKLLMHSIGSTMWLRWWGNKNREAEVGVGLKSPPYCRRFLEQWEMTAW